MKYRKHLKYRHLSLFDSLAELTRHAITTVEKIDESTLDDIIHEYANTSVPTLVICKRYNFNFRKYITDLGLKHKTISESTSSKECIDKRSKSMLEKYGVDNASKAEEVKEKKRETSIRNYGVDNIWKTPTYRREWEKKVFAKYGKVCLRDLYGNENSFGWKTISEEDKAIRIDKLHESYLRWYYSLGEDEREAFILSKIAKSFTSKLETRIAAILKANSIKYEPQVFISRHSYDFKINENFILEVNGTYWHCDPRFYEETDTITRDGDTHLVREVWNKDVRKKILAEKHGYHLFYIWECDMNDMTDDEILSYILDKMQIPDR
ncbi:MAG: hypothetical protein WC358_09665 [Ignavibacteria bacterium]|jgi:G:T-mismatch repair DNA endonuclease (very short patch repair protein)